jgi:hypothetical protein
VWFPYSDAPESDLARETSSMMKIVILSKDIENPCPSQGRISPNQSWDVIRDAPPDYENHHADPMTRNMNLNLSFTIM